MRAFYLPFIAIEKQSVKINPLPVADYIGIDWKLGPRIP
jgi:hypothetical protein